MAPRLAILAAAVVMSTGGAAIKSATLPGIEIAALRAMIAALVLLLITPARHSLRDARAAAVGAAIATTMVLFVVANKLTTAANTVFLQYAGPLYVLIVAPRVLGEEIRRRDLPHIAALAVGLCLFFVGSEQPSTTAPNPALGNVLAMLSGVSWAATIIGLRWLASRDSAARGRTQGELVSYAQRSGGHGARVSRRGSAEAAAVYGNLFAFLAGLSWIVNDVHAAIENWGVLAYLGIVQVGLGYMLFSTGIRHVSAPEASLLLLIEPALNPLWAWIVHGEQPGAWALAGGAIILGATAVRTAIDLRQRDASGT